MTAKRTIIFDLGKVIIPFDFERGYQAIAADCRLPAAEIRSRIAATGLVGQLESGLVEPAEFVGAISRLIDFPGSYQDFCRHWSSIFLPETLIPEELILDLKTRYRLLVLSNTNAIHIDMVREQYGILRHFDHLVLSHEVKAMKPDPRIYAAALAHAKAEPQECFFTDDIAEYVEGARRAGIDAEQFTGYADLLGHLRHRGVVR
ncbi:MAG: HAD family phosphatase [Acidobacteria bacterium]|jgi:FMN phosphatase YigB (HAD superfamily)|nr:HAD family phosphatase [Acidobacteriota bacterium]